MSFVCQQILDIITCTIAPIVWLPSLYPRGTSISGLGDVQFSAFLSPAKPNGWIWGVGAITQLPTHTNDVLGKQQRRARSDGRPATPVSRRSLGLWRAGQQCVVGDAQPLAVVQQTPAACAISRFDPVTPRWWRSPRRLMEVELATHHEGSAFNDAGNARSVGRNRSDRDTGNWPVKDGGGSPFGARREPRRGPACEARTAGQRYGRRRVVRRSPRSRGLEHRIRAPAHLAARDARSPLAGGR